MEEPRLRHAAVLLGALVACSLIAAPVTMSDWGEQAVFSVERVDRADLDGELPVLEYESLSPAAQDAIDDAIDAPDGRHIVYGQADWPDEFFYTYNGRPGEGIYAITDGDQYYRLSTSVSGGLPPIYWLLELPFVLYGCLLAWIVSQTYRERYSIRFMGVATLFGVSCSLLGPAFDFPVFKPLQFVVFGAVLMTVVGSLALLQRILSETESP